MKKIFSLITSLFLLAVLPIGAQSNQPIGTEVITLSHNGQETNFKYNEMTKVMEQAADGDTVFFSTGYFQGDFRLDKKLTFIGSGADQYEYDSNGYRYNGSWSNCTCYDGKIVIALPEGTQLTSRLFDGIYFNNNGNNALTFTSSIDNVVFRKCSWESSNFLNNINADIQNMLIDRCNANVWIPNTSSSIKKLIVRNSKITLYEYSITDPSARIYTNCDVSVNSGSCLDNNCDKQYTALVGTFTNCIINNATYSDRYVSLGNPNAGSTEVPAVLINCVYNKPNADYAINCTIQNCYENTSTDVNLSDMKKADIEAKGWMGNNGTVIGCYGGKNPYTLRPNIPEVSSSKVHLDRDAKQLQINIKVSAQQ